MTIQDDKTRRLVDALPTLREERKVTSDELFRLRRFISRTFFAGCSGEPRSAAAASVDVMARAAVQAGARLVAAVAIETRQTFWKKNKQTHLTV